VVGLSICMGVVLINEIEIHYLSWDVWLLGDFEGRQMQ